MKIWDVALPSELRICLGIKMLNNTNLDYGDPSSLTVTLNICLVTIHFI